jgi:hypothetical protein
MNLPEQTFKLGLFKKKNYENELFLGPSFESNFAPSGITTIRFLNPLSKIELLAETLLGVKCETGLNPSFNTAMTYGQTDFMYLPTYTRPFLTSLS